MKYFYFILLLITKTFNSYANDDKQILFDQSTFDKKSTLSSNPKSVTLLIKEINDLALNDTAKLFLIAGWIYDNINYDMDQFKIGGNINSYKNVFNTKKGLCGDYAVLFAEICNQLKIENEIIQGYVQELGIKKVIFNETNHAWNVVKLGGQWFHCDLLWMSGSLKINEGNYIFFKNLDTKMFLTQEQSFYLSHIPADPIWQLNTHPSLFNDLIHGQFTDSTLSNAVDFNKQINEFMKLNAMNKSLKSADNIFEYNNYNNSIVVINYLNAAVKLLNTNSKDPKTIQIAKNYLLKSKKYLEQGPFFDENIKVQITQMQNAINK